MTISRLEFLAGVFVLLGMAAVTWLTIKVGSGSLPAGQTYVIEARFANATGLSRGGSVVVAGVPVGRVEAIRIDPVDFSAIATLRVSSELNLPTDSMASIKTSGLIGDKFIAIAPGADDTSLQAGDRITLTESAVDLESLIGKVAFGNVEKGDEPVPPVESTPVP